MIQQYGGELHNPEAQALVDRVGERVVAQSDAGKTDWQYDFHLLADPRTINAFALPGGQVFITAALLQKLQTEGQLAGVLGHEVGHVVARHSAQRMAKEQLTQGITGAVLVASGSGDDARMAQMIGQMVNMKYGREDELQSDTLGVRFMSQAGYDPRAMVGVQEILAAESGGNAPPEMMSTHPSAPNRIQTIEAAIEADLSQWRSRRTATLNQSLHDILKRAVGHSRHRGGRYPPRRATGRSPGSPADCPSLK